MKLSKTRKRIIEILKKSKTPVNVESFVKKIEVNKTTVYRELDNLINLDLINEVDFDEGKKRYELKELEHHHHLICLKCSDVKDVTVNEKFEVPKDFKVVKHNLEFFGYCSLCR